jgi:5-formyltetrahydrofolate cyclo-ligase
MQGSAADGGGKDTLRAWILRRRANRSNKERAAVADAIAAHLSTAVFAQVPMVAAYLSMASEPGTGPLIDALIARGTEVIVPVTLADGALDWVRYDPDAHLTGSALGVPEPDGPRLGADAISDAGLVIAPALAVDHSGWRLGRGAGYFDRALARARGPICALVYAEEIVSFVPHEGHDVPVHLVVSEAGIFRVPELPSR